MPKKPPENAGGAPETGVKYRKNIMVIYNAATRELTAKIVYYGPGLGGKTTNLHLLHERLEPGTVGKLLNLATQTDRTIYFDLLPVELGDIKGYKIRFQLATVPGQTAFNETRRVVLKGADGIVFVADSQWTMLPKNLESWQNLKDNLKANGVSFEGVPIVIQYNKRDLSDILSVDALQEALGLSSYPFVEAVASAGRGVTETFKLISKLTFVDLLRRLQGRRPEEPTAPGGIPKREADDLLSWKDSLLSRTSPGTKRSLALVPTPPPEEAPFAAEEEPAASAESEGPFAEASAAAQGLEEAPSELEQSALPAEPEIEVPVLPEPAPPPTAFEIAQTPVDSTPPPIPAPIEIELPEELPPPVLPPTGSLEPTAFAALADLEARLQEAATHLDRDHEEIARVSKSLGALLARFEAFERDARALGKGLGERQDGIVGRLEALEKSSGEEVRREAETRMRGLEDRMAAFEKRQRTAEDDVSLALRSFGERGEKLHQQLSGFVAQLETLEAALQDKTGQSRREADDIRGQLSTLEAAIEEKIGQGRREAEDIRTQISPLLEAHDRRHEADGRLLEEFDRLRESLADSLGDLSERLRRAVRGL